MKHSGKKILVTRPKHQAENMCALIEQQGWEAIQFPLIEIQASSLSAHEQSCLHNIDQYRLIFFVSANAVNFALPLFNGKMEQLQKVACIAVGKASYIALKAYDIKQVLVPEQGFNSEAILAMAEVQDLHSQSCLIIRGTGGREFLADSLRERGARVDYLQVYQRTMPMFDGHLLGAYIRGSALAAILIYSGDALMNLLQMLAKENLHKSLLDTPIVVISQRVRDLARKIGFKHIIIAAKASDAAMMNALLNEEESG